jgi:hypothetical protein
MELRLSLLRCRTLGKLGIPERKGGVDEQRDEEEMRNKEILSVYIRSTEM